MLEEQISPILGLTLLEMIDLFGIGSILIAIGTAIALYVSTTRAKKTESAHISLKLLEMGRNDQFKEIFKKMNNDKEINEDDARTLLRYYEFIAEFWKDRVLSYDHVLHIHGRNLKMMYHNTHIRKVFDEARTNQSSYNYVNLYDLFLKIDDSL